MARKRKDKKERQGGIFVVIALIALLMCAGAWNYQRNLALEEENQGARAFKGYDDASLEQLAEAYADEADALRRRYESALARRRGARHKDGLLSAKVKEFERVRSDGDRIRAINAEVAEKEARLRDIRVEQDYRLDKKDLDLHLRRLTSL